MYGSYYKQRHSQVWIQEFLKGEWGQGSRKGRYVGIFKLSRKTPSEGV